MYMYIQYAAPIKKLVAPPHAHAKGVLFIIYEMRVRYLMRAHAHLDSICVYVCVHCVCRGGISPCSCCYATIHNYSMRGVIDSYICGYCMYGDFDGLYTCIQGRCRSVQWSPLKFVPPDILH